MSSVATDPLEEIIRDSGEGWLIDWYAPRERALPELREILRRADEAARNRLGDNAPRLTPESLLAAYSRNPHKVRAFLQVVASVASPEILVMTWRILQGMNIADIELAYQATGTFHLHVSLSWPHTNETEEYDSTDIDDAGVLRHLATMKMDNHGIFDGFYALNLGK